MHGIYTRYILNEVYICKLAAQPQFAFKTINGCAKKNLQESSNGSQQCRVFFR